MLVLLFSWLVVYFVVLLFGWWLCGWFCCLLWYCGCWWLLSLRFLGLCEMFDMFGYYIEVSLVGLFVFVGVSLGFLLLVLFWILSVLNVGL